MKPARAALALVLGLACAGVPPPLHVDTLRREAMLEADVDVLRELFAEGLRYGHANGEVHTKAELLGLLASGALDYRAIRIEAIETREGARSFVVTGRQTIEVTAAGRDVTSHSVFSAVYAREGRRWRLIAYQSAPIPPRSAAPSRPAAAPAH
jgi:hypothetical protein